MPMVSPDPLHGVRVRIYPRHGSSRTNHVDAGAGRARCTADRLLPKGVATIAAPAAQQTGGPGVRIGIGHERQKTGENRVMVRRYSLGYQC
ncbi:hypothetical protein EC845_0111 [Comamonas sp. BIGb0124]|nr:hypothetical protein EC845_0111 [Comamonas sp. BIGb0124]